MAQVVTALLKDTLSGLLDLLYPPKCAVCLQIGPNIICGKCRGGFGWFEGQVCKKCGGVLRNNACRDCADGSTRHTTKARAAGRFEGSLRDAIHQFKYQGKRKLAEPLGGFLEEYLLEKPFGKVAFDLVIPVPLHSSRLRERDFNQADLLAESASSYLGLPLLRDEMVRTRHTKRPADLHAKERVKNVQGAFAVRAGDAIVGKCVLLIDD